MSCSVFALFNTLAPKHTPKKSKNKKNVSLSQSEVARQGGIPCSLRLFVLRGFAFLGTASQLFSSFAGSAPSFLRQCQKVVVNVRIMGVCWSVSIHFTHHHHHHCCCCRRRQQQQHWHRWVQNENHHHPPTQYCQNPTSFNAVALLSFSTHLRLTVFSFTCCSVHQQPAFYAVGLFPVFTSFICICSPSFSIIHSDPFLAVRSDCVLRIGALYADVPQMSRALQKFWDGDDGAGFRGFGITNGTEQQEVLADATSWWQ